MILIKCELGFASFKPKLSFSKYGISSCKTYKNQCDLSHVYLLTLIQALV